MMKAADCRLKHGLKMGATLFLNGYLNLFSVCNYMIICVSNFWPFFVDRIEIISRMKATYSNPPLYTSYKSI